MREIKFRAWDEKRGHWVIPTIHHSGYNLNELLNSIEDDGLQLVQYTGLKDKNGVEIYEGDVVKDLTTKTYFGSKKIMSRRGQVKYGNYYAVADDPYCSADVTGFYIDGDVFSNNLKDYFDKDIEVIGNIYENPELLESK